MTKKGYKEVYLAGMYRQSKSYINAKIRALAAIADKESSPTTNAIIPNTDAAIDMTGHSPICCLNCFHFLSVEAPSLTMLGIEKMLIFFA